jgi:hypothetical protein
VLFHLKISLNNGDLLSNWINHLPVKSVIFAVMFGRVEMAVSEPIAHAGVKVNSEQHLKGVHVLGML